VHARTLFRRAYKGLSETPWAEPSLPRTLAAELAETYEAEGPRLVEAERSGYDRSVKFLVELKDGLKVETVLMPEKQRITLCLSSQVGCAQGCVFCHTGRMGLVRNLTAGEIVGQVVAANRWILANPEWLAETRLPATQRISNLVFMGMGEPLDNVDGVIEALHILTDPLGLALGLARISVSTAGHLDGLEALFAAIPKVRVALSVHCTDDSKRSRIMPINRRWPLAQVIERLKTLTRDGAPVMLQYTMIDGVNDSLEEAHRLAALADGLNAKVNLIPLNNVSASRLRAPTPEKIQAFRDVLHQAGLRVMVRYSKGQDIAAACGQLIV
jgi:23S rRNA (adenine2503-C2)-methyltransferase